MYNGAATGNHMTDPDTVYRGQKDPVSEDLLEYPRQVSTIENRSHYEKNREFFFK